MRGQFYFWHCFFVALTSGAAFAVWLDSSPSGLSPAFYIEKMQHTIRVFTIPLNTVAILGVLFTIASTFLARHDRFIFYLLIGASICALAATLITFVINVPIINQITTWSMNSPPSNWMEVGEKWWLSQAIRTALIMVELGLLILSVMTRRGNMELREY
jgi:uncharacterized membrane protein